MASVVRSALARLGAFGPTPLTEMGEVILWSVRLPRVLIAALVGGGLAVVGAALQALFRNPLADAGLLGVGPGAALGAVLAVNLGWAQQRFLAMPLAACAGALLALLLIYAIAHAGGRPTLSGLLLTGLAVSALAGAGTSVCSWRSRSSACAPCSSGWPAVSRAAATSTSASPRLSSSPGRSPSCCSPGLSMCSPSGRRRRRRSAFPCTGSGFWSSACAPWWQGR